MRILLLFFFLSIISGCASSGISVSVDTDPYRQEMIDHCVAENPEDQYCNLSVDRFVYLAEKNGFVWNVAKDDYHQCLKEYQEPEIRSECYEPHYREAWEKVVSVYKKSG